MQYATSLGVIGVLSLSLIIAVAAQLSAPERMLQQPMWPTDMPLILQLQNDPARPLELKISDHHGSGHHHHRSPGKPGADVTLAGPGIRTLSLGSAQDLQLEIQSQHLTRGSLTIRLEPSQDLQLVSGGREWNFELNGEQTLALPISVQALAEGQHYIHLFIEHLSQDGVTTARALATEFRVGGDFPTRAYAKSFSMESRSEYRTLPASEEIY